MKNEAKIKEIWNEDMADYQDDRDEMDKRLRSALSAIFEEADGWVVARRFDIDGQQQVHVAGNVSIAEALSVLARAELHLEGVGKGAGFDSKPALPHYNYLSRRVDRAARIHELSQGDDTDSSELSNWFLRLVRAFLREFRVTATSARIRSALVGACRETFQDRLIDEMVASGAVDERDITKLRTAAQHASLLV